VFTRSADAENRIKNWRSVFIAFIFYLRVANTVVSKSPNKIAEQRFIREQISPFALFNLPTQPCKSTPLLSIHHLPLLYAAFLL
jgi:hypothetical protein